MLVLHQANRTESLLDGLLELLSRPLSDPLRPETILVQSQGMARWLALRIAKAQGVAANLEFPFPSAFLWRLMGQTTPDGPSPYGPGPLRWALMELISRQGDEPDLAPLTAYLQGPGAELKRYHLAGRLAGLLDRYLVYRPDWIKDWDQGRGQGWQPALWRELTRHLGPHHRLALQERLAEALNDPRPTIQLDLPERLILFGVPALPESHLQLFDHLSRRMETHLFLLTPSGQFWADLADRRQLAKASLRHGQLDPQADLHLDQGCPLLMGLGRLGREFQALLAEFDTQPGGENFHQPGADTVLGLLQSDLNAALEQGPLPDDERPAADDRSLVIHSAHSPLREVEILRDQLLDLLARHPLLEAEDILVMAPDIAAYAPLVEAVFAEHAGEGAHLPFGIAGQGDAGPFTKTFIELLDLLASRFPVSQTLAFLEQEPVRRRFSLTGDELELIRAWARQANINWGLSPGHRAQLGVPEETPGSWRTGLDGLLLGLVTPPGADLLHGLLPRDCLEIGQGPLLARLLDIVEALERLAGEAAIARPLASWRDLLLKALDQFLRPNEEEGIEQQNLRQAVNGLAKDGAQARHQESLPLEVIRAAILDRLPASGGRFPCGRLTFSQLAPMRGIPFPVICLLGMNDTAFPRDERPLSFDLMAAQPRPGDQRRRDDDRYLFLETILSARKVLYLSYVGKNRDQGPAPPSVVISELLDHLGHRLALDPEACERRFLTQHPLQPFSRRYFAGDGRLFSYSSRNLLIAQSLLAPPATYPGLFAGHPETEPDPKEGEIELETLIDFFTHPVRFLLQKRYDLHLDPREEEPFDREPFDLDHLKAYNLRSRLTKQTLSTGGADRLPVVQARGEVAWGLTGRLQYQGCQAEVEQLARRVRELGGEPRPPLPVRLDLGGTLLFGTLNNLSQDGQLLYRAGKLSSQSHADLIKLWLRHLVLCLAQPEDQPQASFIYQDGLWRHEFQPQARQHLLRLLVLYRYGQRRPLPLLPKASLAYAKKLEAGGAQALEQARQTWEEGAFNQEPEGRDPYLAAAFGDLDPLAGDGPYDFAEVARLALVPPLSLGSKRS
ncbi:MAG: exodeoxyribonuclease V subunit gamma [Desulfobacteraceae bacterium]|nr:exodeoxyribonuclease V subunit gamma [Desulfobacteraceae bacterium]